MSVSALKALVADDHALMRAGLRALFSKVSAGAVVLEAADLDGVLAGLAAHEDVRLVVVDLDLSGMGGVSGITRIHAVAPSVSVVVVSVRERALDVRQAIKAGAIGFIPKSSPPELVVGALNLVLSGGMYLPPHVLELDERADAAIGVPVAPALSARLTERQREVLALLAEGKSNKEIAAILGLAAGTVKIHVSRIFRVLNVRNRTHASIAVARALDGIEGPG